MQAQIQRKAAPLALYAATILLSAFLLFQVQPLIAKLILPWFGGSAAVWTSCMLFFQIALLGGYAYAHWLNEQSSRRQKSVHLGLLALSLLSLPILPSQFWKPEDPGEPLLRILGLLTATVGLPYFLLSSTSPLLQSWYSRSNGGVMPYRLFALSNAGSMAGLLTYPVLIEPNLTNRIQAWTWSAGYALFAVVCGTVAFRTRAYQLPRAERPFRSSPAPPIGSQLLWIALAACPSALLLAVTNHVTQNIAPIPFLWVLPLSLYLLSFILCFDSDRWYRRGVFTSLAAITLPLMAWAIVNGEHFIELKAAVMFFGAASFVIFMVCHGELARRRPAAEHLTSFYLMVSLGGAIGGLLIGFAAPYLFRAVFDLQVVLVLTGGLFTFLLWQAAAPPPSAAERGPAAALPYARAQTLSGLLSGRAVLLAWTALLASFAVIRVAAAKNFGAPRFLKGAYDPPILFALAAMLLAYLGWPRSRKIDVHFARFAVALAAIFAISAYLAHDVWGSIADTRIVARNFYGSLQVYDSETSGSQGPVRVLRHGTIDHGEQFLWLQNQRRPTTYFTGPSGIGLTIHELQRRGPMSVGIIGLGAGSIAAYCRAGDTYRYYEINPLVLRVANSEFTYLSGCPAGHDVLLGDARLVLERQSNQNFDLLVVDAFSGDAIPVHLLTREAAALYWRHLKPDGVLAVHVSNRYLRLAPVVALAAAGAGKRAKMVSYEGGDTDEEASSDWVLVTSRPGFFDQAELKKKTAEIEPIPSLHPWTDDYSNVYRILR